MKSAERPAPKPKVEARPLRLSVTAIEDWLRDPYTIYARHILRLSRSMRSTRRPGARPRHHHPWRHRRLHREVRRPAAGRSTQGIAQARRKEFRQARGFSRGARLLVAALHAYRAMVRAMGQRAARRPRGAACGNSRRIEIPGGSTRVHTLRHRRPHRTAPGGATPSSTTRPARRAPKSRCARASRRN